MKNCNKKVSIIVPIYNIEKYLNDCLSSLVNQSYPNIEIILVNDGSTDESLKICKNFQEKYPNIIVINQENGGVSNARNCGIKNCSGDFVTFVDSDDFIDKDMIKTLVKNYNSGELVRVLHNNVINGKRFLIHINQKVFNNEDYVQAIINGKMMGAVWGYLFDASIIKKLCFDEKTNYLEDMIFIIEYLQKSKVNIIKLVDEGSYYNYLLNESSITNNKKMVFDHCEKITYSLNQINIKTNFKYTNKLSDKKIRILEGELRFVNDKDMMLKICNTIKINKYSSFKLRYFIFSILVRKKRVCLLLFYYNFRHVIKKLLKRNSN